MPERGFDTGFWGDKWVRTNVPHSRYLFIYLWTNDHCNQAAVYEITLETMAFETGLPETEISDLLKGMYAKVKWLPDQDIIWVKNFIKRQSKSPKFLIAAAKCLKKIKDTGLVAEVLEYNRTQYSISIPYQYTIDSVSIPSVSVSVSGSRSVSDEEIGVVKGEEEEIPRSEPEIFKELFDLWNSLGIIKHKNLTGDMTRTIKAASRDFSAAEISQAMKNYARIVNDEQCFFKYRWTLKDFLKRGLEKFLDLEVALNNYRKGGANGESRKQGVQATGTDRRYTQAATDEQYRRGLPPRRRQPAK